MRGCMILAAGFGTRMGALTKDRPKPLIPVAGKPLIDHALDQARAAAGRIVVNGHYLADQMRAHLAGMEDVTFQEEMPEILDSAGGIRAALPLLGGTEVFTLNADAVWTGARALGELDAAWDAQRMDALLLMLPQPRAVGRQPGGDFAIGARGGSAGTRRARSIPGRRSSRPRFSRATSRVRFRCMRSGTTRWRGGSFSARCTRADGPMWATRRALHWPRKW